MLLLLQRLFRPTSATKKFSIRVMQVLLNIVPYYQTTQCPGLGLSQLVSISTIPSPPSTLLTNNYFCGIRLHKSGRL